MNRINPHITMPQSVAAQIAHLPDLSMAEIRALWQKLGGSDTPTYNRQFLERRIAYRLQEVEFRKVDATLLESNQRRIATLIDAGKEKKRGGDYFLVAGTMLSREYKGIIHKVVVNNEGRYDFQGRMYPSLSMIAREITGTRWSGPLFFGLKQPATPKATAKKGARR